MERLVGKVAVVTGAGRGIGRATATRFAEEGARVVVAEIDEDGGRATVAAILEAGNDARFVGVDVTDPTSVEALFDSVGAEEGALHVLHNNAGGSTTHDGPVTEVPLDEWWRTINVDLYGTFLCSRFGVPLIAGSGGGSVINMGSAVSILGTTGRDAYTAAKGGVIAMTRSMAKNFRTAGVRVNAIAPGGVATERILAMMGDAADRWTGGMGVPAIGTARRHRRCVRLPRVRRGASCHRRGAQRRRRNGLDHGPRGHLTSAPRAVRPGVPRHSGREDNLQ